MVFSILVKPVFPLVDYAVNYNYIAQVLCVNKAKPELKCNGKCHLMKELAKAAESESMNEKSTSSDKKSTSKQEVETLYFQEFFRLVPLSISANRSSVVCDSYCNLYSKLNASAVYHPPIFIY